MAAVYLIVLAGQGDTDVRVVDKETFEWVTSKNPGQPGAHPPINNQWIDTLVPDSQLAKRNGEPVRLTTGSWWNDRMLAAECFAPYDGYASLRDALKAVKANGDEIEDTVEGMIY